MDSVFVRIETKFTPANIFEGCPTIWIAASLESIRIAHPAEQIANWIADGQAVMRTRKGLDWTEDFAAIAEAAGAFEECILDGEVVALDHNGAPDFAALQGALSKERSGDLTYFVFDLLFDVYHLNGRLDGEVVVDCGDPQ